MKRWSRARSVSDGSTTRRSRSGLSMETTSGRTGPARPLCHHRPADPRCRWRADRRRDHLQRRRSRAEAIPRPRRLGAEDLAVPGQTCGPHHRPAVEGGRGAGRGAGHRPRHPGGDRQDACLSRSLAGGRMADRAGLLHRRRRAGPADPAAVRPGGGGGRCLPRGAGRGPLRDPGPGGARCRPRGHRADPACQGQWQTVVERFRGAPL